MVKFNSIVSEIVALGIALSPERIAKIKQRCQSTRMMRDAAGESFLPYTIAENFAPVVVESLGLSVMYVVPACGFTRNVARLWGETASAEARAILVTEATEKWKKHGLPQDLMASLVGLIALVHGLDAPGSALDEAGRKIYADMQKQLKAAPEPNSNISS